MARRAQFPKIKGFEILKKLGEGGMGVVYQARNIALDRLVAIKCILAEGEATEDDQARFQREAQAIARFVHPHIVQIFSTGKVKSQSYLELEYVDGGNLLDVWQANSTSPAQAASLIEQVARAMAAAHAKGIIHRDLKPPNVLLTRDGQAKVSDFGLARQLDSKSLLTRRGQGMGTYGYMSPEQSAGELDRIGPATDIYAIGLMLHNLLTGAPPFFRSWGEFSGSWAEVQTRLDTTHVPAPSTVVPGVPAELDDIVADCLRKKPEDRPTAAELVQRLQAFLARHPADTIIIPALPTVPGTPQPAQTPAKSGIGAFLLTLVVVGLLTWVNWPPPPKPAIPLQDPNVPTQPQITPTVPIGETPPGIKVSDFLQKIRRHPPRVLVNGTDQPDLLPAYYSQIGPSFGYWRVLNPVTAEQATRRAYTFRTLTNQAGQLVIMEAVNAHNILTDQYWDVTPCIETLDPLQARVQPARFQFNYDAQNAVESVVAYDAANAFLWKFQYGSAQFLNAEGQVFPRSGTVAGIGFLRDVQQRESGELFFDASGMATSNSEHAFGFLMELDDAGQCVLTTCTGNLGIPAPHERGFVHIRIERDAAGNVIRLRYLDLDHKPARHADGYAVVEFKYDADGNRIEQAFRDQNDQPVVALGLGYAGIFWRLNEWGEAVESVYFNEQYMQMNGPRGYCKERRVYDPSGQLVTSQYFDASDQLLDLPPE